MVSKVFTAALFGLEVKIIEVEVHIARGNPSFKIVGLPDKTVDEAKGRVMPAIKTSGASFPYRRLTVNLAPADFPKFGSSYDLPISIGILLATNQIKNNFQNAIFFGELALDGNIRHVRGILPLIEGARRLGYTNFFVPLSNFQEANIVNNIAIAGLSNLNEIVNECYDFKTSKLPVKKPLNSDLLSQYDMCHVKGQAHAKRALEIAVAGGHNILLKGSPGSGKTYLAKTVPSIMPHMTLQEQVETTKIYSVSGLIKNNQGLVTSRPFRSPHSTTSEVAMIGGGKELKPGEITLAHNGVLFLDEFPEFPRNVIETLRQPLEDKIVTISRALGSVTYPSDFILLAAMNPCKCGWYGDDSKECTCSNYEILQYSSRISEPILDRIDIQLYLKKVRYKDITNNNSCEENSDQIRNRVERSRKIQLKRYKRNKFKKNSDMTNQFILNIIKKNRDISKFINYIMDKKRYTLRSTFKIIKVSQSIADLDEEILNTSHIAEALNYRLNSDS